MHRFFIGFLLTSVAMSGVAEVKPSNQAAAVEQQPLPEVMPVSSGESKLQVFGVDNASGSTKYGYISIDGELVIPPQFDEAGDFAANGLAKVERDGKTGFINAKGEWVFQLIKYDSGGDVVLNGAGEQIWPELIDLEEVQRLYDEVVATNQPLLERVTGNCDCNNLFAVSVKVAGAGKKHGYASFDVHSELVIPPKFDDARNFVNGLAWVIQGDKYGFINAQGEWVIRPQFDEAGSFAANGLAWVIQGDKYGFINAQGEWVVRPQFDEAGHFAANGLARVKQGDKYGFINAKGEWVISPQFDYVDDFVSNDLARVKQDGKYGFINAQGAWVIRPQDHYHSLGKFHANGLATASQDGKHGYINTQGEWVIPPQFDFAVGFWSHDSLAQVMQDGKYGYINAQGEWVIHPQYSSLGSFSDNGLAAAQRDSNFDFTNTQVQRDTKYGFINTQGEWVIPPQYEIAFEFTDNGLAKVRQLGKNGYIDAQYGYINAQGEWVFPPQFDDAYGFYGDFAKVKQDGRWGFMNTQGEWIIQYSEDETVITNGAGKQIWPVLPAE